MSLFEHKEDQPFHISVGAVLVNAEGKIRAHRFISDKAPEKTRYKLGGLSEVYTLMKETIENGESLEEAVARGIKEEFGAEGKMRKYLGSLQFEVEGFEKTELYFLVDFVSDGGERDPNDAESYSELVWETPEFLMERMREQGYTASRRDLDQSKIIEAYLKYGV